MIKLRITGVPEHFNLPWHLAIDEGLFKKAGIDLQWTDSPGGTGAMCKSLREGTTDLSVMLTEGTVSDIIQGNPSRIISIYVVSPLIWGVHTSSKNPLDDYKEIYQARYAISRFGSGSHLMPQVDALIHGRKLQQDQFTVVKNLKGALESLTSLDTDVFYWEKYTTKPYVDSGILKRIGEFVTPWPCFVIVASENAIEEYPEVLKTLLEVIQSRASSFMSDPDTLGLVAKRYEQVEEDVDRWLHSTIWSDHSQVNPRMLENVMFSLKEAGIIDEMKSYDELVWN